MQSCNAGKGIVSEKKAPDRLALDQCTIDQNGHYWYNGKRYFGEIYSTYPNDSIFYLERGSNMQYFWPNGQLMLEVLRSWGASLLHQKAYNPEGGMLFEQTYRTEIDKGYPEGLWKYSYPDGTLLMENPVDWGKRKIYHPNGQIFVSCPVSSKKVNGVMTMYTANRQHVLTTSDTRSLCASLSMSDGIAYCIDAPYTGYTMSIDQWGINTRYQYYKDGNAMDVFLRDAIAVSQFQEFGAMVGDPAIGFIIDHDYLYGYPKNLEVLSGPNTYSLKLDQGASQCYSLKFYRNDKPEGYWFVFGTAGKLLEVNSYQSGVKRGVNLKADSYGRLTAFADE